MQHIQRSKASTICQSIRHEVHRPCLIGSVWNGQSIRLIPFEPLLGPDPQVQLQLAINPVDPFVIPGETFNVAQVQETQPKAPVPAVGRQTHKPVSDDTILIVEFTLIPITRFADAKRPA